MGQLDKHEKWLHFGASFLAVGFSFTADLLGVSLSEDTLWLLRAFAGGAAALGAVKVLTNRASV